MNTERPQLRTALAVTVAFLGSCGGDPAPVQPAPPFADPGFIDSGDHRLHYALTLTRDLPSAIAGSYGIVQRHNLALLTIALEPRGTPGGAPIRDPAVGAAAIALTGERVELQLTRHDAAGRPTWLATVAVRHRVPVTIEIRARATSASPEIRARLTREFRLD